ncbi:MAG: LexA repressor [Gammaproteobacteria bacterium]|nr:MAG: LexA repressor [Gammaproteobacteria bacterium]RLA53504.1 MAG: LexA repressor [Gammaproteobacteria bacterium]
MTQGLTARQAQILELIQQSIAESGYPPTRAEIAKKFGFRSANAAEEHLRALARKGFVEITKGASRGIRLIKPPQGLPIIGQVAAGCPILAEQNIEDYCDVPGSLFSIRADFMLRVKGDSMCDAGILDGDLLAVHKTPTAENSQIIIARVDNEVTVKRLKRTRSRYTILLLPENRNYDPIEVNLREQEFAIEGLYVGILRNH